MYVFNDEIGAALVNPTKEDYESLFATNFKVLLFASYSNPMECSGYGYNII